MLNVKYLEFPGIFNEFELTEGADLLTSVFDATDKTLSIKVKTGEGVEQEITLTQESIVNLGFAINKILIRAKA